MIALVVAAAAVQPQTVLTIDPRHRIVEGVASDGKRSLDKPGFVRTQGAPIVAVPLSEDCKPQ